MFINEIKFFLNNMNIFGRCVESVKYGDKSGVRVYVHQKLSDCKHMQDSSYQCENMCAGKYVVVRFFPDGRIFATGLVPKRIFCEKEYPKLGNIHDLPDLEEIAKKEAWELKDMGEGTLLYHNGKPVAGYLNCGLYDMEKLLSKEVRETIAIIKEKAEQLKSQARNESFIFFCYHDPQAQRMRQSYYMRRAKPDAVRLINTFLARDVGM